MTEQDQRAIAYDEVPVAKRPRGEEESREFRIVEQIDEDAETGKTTDVSTESDGSRTVGARVGKAEYDGAHESGDAVPIIYGVVDDSHEPAEGIEGIDVSIEILRNGETVETFTPTTNEHGGGIVEFTAPDQDGKYTASVGYDNEYINIDFRVGEHLDLNPEFDNSAVRDTTMTVSLQATTGDQPRPGVEYEIDITKPDESTETVPVTTDENGFGTFEFVPSQLGEYRLSVDYQSGGSELEIIDVFEYVANVDATNEFDVIPGDTVACAGHIVGPGRNRVSGLDLEIDVLDSTDSTVDTITATTDTNGVVAFTWQSPDTEGRYEFDIQTAGGVDVKEDFLLVSLNGSSGGSSGLNFSLDSQSYRTVPGGTITTNIAASDGEDPLGGKTVDVAVFADYDGTAPLEAKTVQLDTNGERTVELSVPEAAPDSINVTVEAGLDYDGERKTRRRYHEIRRYSVTESYSLVAGGTGTVTYTIEDVATGDPITDEPVLVGLLRRTLPGSNIGTNSGVTDSNGQVQLEYDLPIDTGDAVRLADAGFGSRKSYYGYATVDVPMDVEVALTPAQPTAGETVEVSYTVSGDVQTPVNAAVTVAATESGDSISETAPLSTTLTPGETAEFTAPEITTTDNVGLEATAIVLDGRGALVEERDYSTIQSPTFSISASGDTISSGGQAEISLSASAVDTITIEDLWIDWEIAGTNADGGTFTDNVSSAGSCEFSWSSVQGSVSPSITVDVPSRYVGGTYVLTVSASSSSESGQTTALVEIQ